MKICVIGQEYPPLVEGGQGEYMHQLAETLSARGHDVEVYAQGNATSVSTENGVKINRFSTIDVPLIRLLDIGRKFSRHLRNKEFDVYHVNAPHLALFMNKKPLVITAHSTLLSKGKSIQRLGGQGVSDKVASFYYRQSYFLEKKVYERARVIIAVNSGVRTELEQIYKIGKERIATVYNGVNTRIFYAKENKAELKEEFGLGSRDFVVLYVGRLAAIKNVDLLVRAMYLLREYNIVALVVGRGAKEGALRRQVKKFGIQNKVRFTGYINNRDLINVYNAADVFVLPSIYEGLPLSLLESMACSVPAIATSFHGVENIVQDGRNGLILKKATARTLAEKIAYLNREPGVLHDMGLKAMEVIGQRFSWDKTVEEIMTIYEQL